MNDIYHYSVIHMISKRNICLHFITQQKIKLQMCSSFPLAALATRALFCIKLGFSGIIKWCCKSQFSCSMSHFAVRLELSGDEV